MARLPQPGSDKGIWGEILNDFLIQSHNLNGTLRDIPQSKVTGLSASLSAKANATDLANVATTGSYTDLTNKPTIPDTSNLVSNSALDTATAALVSDGASATRAALSSTTAQQIASTRPFVRRQVADGAGFPAASRNVSNSTDTQVQQTQGFRLTEDVADLTFTFQNADRPTASSTSFLGLASVTVRLGLFDGTSTYPIYWTNGSRDMTLEPGAVATTLPLPFKGRKGQRLLIVRRMTWATAPARFPASTLYAGDANCVNERGTALADRTSAYGQFYTRTAGNWAVFPPIAITAQVPTGPVVGIFGDSIASDGSNDWNAYDEAYGWAQGGLSDAGIPWVNFGTASWQLAHLLSSKTGRAQMFNALLAAGVTHALIALSTNDWASGRTSAQLLADLATLKTELAPIGVKIIPVTSLPKTNGNTANAAEANTFAQRALFNTSLRTNTGIGDGFYELAGVVEDPANANAWRQDVQSPSTATLVSAGTGYAIDDYIILPGGAAMLVQAVGAGGTITTSAFVANGGFLVPPTDPVPVIRLASSALGRSPVGVGATFALSGFAAQTPTTDGTHPQAALTRLIREDFYKKAPAVFV